eukprot:CAMPEP_0206236754 /NCGR_PEP_ID=MMETSP0047_2-20121206/13886_1 /ASSEMBLY_ACC=CAM_ASM_000192 /TAXON_ID=195065 /ORGANISM="Chroomonas mesostigmatica_cf, Strain CCMP1168" /LENGTH=72 /DNA_ID=CAMNT_0053661115 /DNA_START=22 /DNA_END=240 /DNA_ORIENTATION=+
MAGAGTPLLVYAAASPLLAMMAQYKSWPEMEGRVGPFMGWPEKRPEVEVKKEELAKLKEKVATLEKEIALYK